MTMGRHAPRRPVAAVVGAVIAVIGLSACATTYDESLAVDTAPSTSSTLPSGSTDELLVRLRTEAFTLSGVMIEGGDRREAYARMVALWEAARPGVADERPDLIEAFERALALSETAVRYQRGADADKAARNIDSLVDVFAA